MTILQLFHSHFTPSAKSRECIHILNLARAERARRLQVFLNAHAEGTNVRFGR